MVLTTASVFPSKGGHQFMPWPSRRSVVHSTKGVVACSQPLAARCGLEILRKGGNAADAAVAVAAGINMTEPCQTGIGGDMFCLFYDAKTKKVSALNGSGRAGGKCTLETIRGSLGLGGADEEGKIPMSSVHAVTVPGAAAGWVDTVERFGSGKLSLEEILGPAIQLGEEGFPVHEQTATIWAQGEQSLRDASPNFREMLKADPNAPDGVRAPKAGDIIKLPNLAKTFRALAAEGKKGFYTGRIAEEIVKVTTSLGGHLTLEDLEHHLTTGSEPVEPISLKFTGQGVGKAENAGVEVWEHPPNGQGIVALMALGILQQLELSGKIPTWTEKDHNTAPYLHAIIESLRIAFSDANWFLADPNVSDVPTAGLLSPEYLSERAKLFSPTKSTPELIPHGSPALRSSDTVYFAVSDSEGNAISFINSNYGGFGTGIIPAGCGFTLQNRGANFSLDPKHPNVLAPRKRPYHTIIPGLVTNINDGSLHSVFGVMGGFMQPQGHVQTLLGQIVGGLNPQQALDAPRVCIGAGMPENGKVYDMRVYVEEGMPEETIRGLEELGHQVTVVRATPGDKWQSRSLFGRGQIIRWTVDSVEENRGVWSAGSDMRGDGGAYPA
ncbi:Putative Gamma-glutamyltranspeptidase precursor [Podospora comata]|uniref:Gamma-glutamyltranspeptidase n=1 Tax=Podospora comata TaxID=48703 RepID=A0ABY6S4Y0_PODCO|nr:Putative Gamma-glutamyltranspeptidase precursor [Podospora comata]